MKHKCKYFDTDQMKDVTIRGGKHIHCRRCGARLTEEQIEKETLTKIKRRIE